MTQPASSSTSPATLAVLVDTLAAELIALYAQAEQQLLADIAVAARQGIDAPAHSAEQYQMLTAMRRAAERISVMLRLRAAPLAQQIAEQAATEGAQVALDSLRRLAETNRNLIPLFTKPLGHGVSAANHIGLDLASKLMAVSFRITRFADDAYRAVVAEAASRQVTSALTPGQAQSFAWRKLTSRGISGFTDSAGRDWNLSSYVEMATRTTVQRAFNASHLDRMLSFGIEFFTINHDGHPCPLCAPWEGAVLSATQSGTLTVRAADRPEFVTVNVDASIAEATAAGLFHPNCRHSLQAYLPGVTQATGKREWTAEDQARYNATQQLRTLERAVRAFKREQAAALNQLDAKRAAAKVRMTQAAIRAHIEQHGLARRPHRESLNLGH